MKKKAEEKKSKSLSAKDRAIRSPEWADTIGRAHHEPHCVAVEMTKTTAIKLTFVVPYKGACALFDALVAARTQPRTPT